MPIDKDFKVTKSEGAIYDPIPENTYQVQIVDVKQVERTTAFGVKQKFQFSCAVTDDEKYIGRLVFVSVNISWFNGKGGKRASALFTLVKTIYSHYKPEVNIMEKEDLSGDEVNDLVGKQFIAVVKVNDKYNNVTDYIKIKKEIPFTPKPIGGTNENVNPDDVEL